MIGTDFFSPAQMIQSEAQRIVGEFLASRSKLTKLQSSSDSGIQAKAGKLLATQSVLENELQRNQEALARVQGGAYTLGDVATLSAMLYGMNSQTSAVKDLFKKAGSPGGLPFDLDFKTILIGASVLIGAVALFRR